MEHVGFLNDTLDGWGAFEKNDIVRFKEAHELAQKAHRNQFRDDGQPYISHINGIIDILKDEMGDKNHISWTVMALHDVIEDSPITYEELKAQFGETVAHCVLMLTKNKKMTVEEYINRIVEDKFSHMLIFYKLVDRLHNVRSLMLITDTHRDKVLKYIKETEKHYIPLAKENNDKIHMKLRDALNEIIDAVDKTK